MISTELRKPEFQTTYRYNFASKVTSPMLAPEDDARTLWMEVFSVLAGLLALFCFMSLGGLFAQIAPWVILAGTRSAMKCPGWQVLGMLTGVSSLTMGSAALLSVGAGHWGQIAGLLGLSGGMGYLVFVLSDVRK